MRFLNFVFVLGCSLVLSAPAFGSMAISFSIDSATAAPGEEVKLGIYATGNGEDVQGWSYGITWGDNAPWADGQPTLQNTPDIKNGSQPDFNQVSAFDNGVTQGTVICFTGCAILPLGETPSLLAELVFTVASDAADQTVNFQFAETLGAPPVAVVAVVGGASQTPVQNAGVLTIQAAGGDDGGEGEVIPEPTTVAIWSVLALCGLAYGFRNKSAKRS